MQEFVGVTPYLYVPFAAWAIAQAIKFVLALVRGDANVRYLYASGGMPSVHSAVVCSLATWALIDGGPNSALFGFTAVFAAIVMYDSFGVRRSAGDQARTLNRLIADLSMQGNLKNSSDYNQLREILGHRPLEVLVGSSLGVVIAICFGFQKLSTDFPWLIQPVYPTVAQWLLVFSGVLMITAPLLYVFALKKYRKAVTVRNNLNLLVYGNAGVGLVLAICSFVAYEQVNTVLSQWWVVILILLVWVIYAMAVKVMLFRSLRSYKPNSENLRKQVWLNKSKKRKSKKRK